MECFMKITKIEGCIVNFLGIDGKAEVKMTDEERLEYFKKICEKIPTLDEYWFNYFLQWVTQTFGEFEMDPEPCECCGDYVTTYTLEM